MDNDGIDAPESCKPLSGRLVLVTGASGGIGGATCIKLARLGGDIAAHYNSDASEAARLVAGLCARGVRAHAFQGDLSNIDEIHALHTAVTQTFGRSIDVLFANAGSTAGLAGVAADINQVSLDVFEHAWRINTLAPFALTQLVIPAMVEQQWGRVVYCSSVAAFTGGVVGPHYASSKAALAGLVHWGSSAYSTRGITFNAVAPALIQDTKMLNSAGSNAQLAQKIPMRRLGRPEEVAETVAWMCSVSYVSNKVIGFKGVDVSAAQPLDA